jgi:hypothetical protein
MTHIEQLHLDAIEESKDYIDTTSLAYVWGIKEKEAAFKSAEITENIAIGFVEWLTKIEAYPCINRELNGLWVMHPQDPKNYTPKELFQEYLKTKEIGINVNQLKIKK